MTLDKTVALWQRIVGVEPTGNWDLQTSRATHDWQLREMPDLPLVKLGFMNPESWRRAEELGLVPKE